MAKISIYRGRGITGSGLEAQIQRLGSEVVEIVSLTGSIGFYSQTDLVIACLAEPDPKPLNYLVEQLNGCGKPVVVLNTYPTRLPIEGLENIVALGGYPLSDDELRGYINQAAARLPKN